jgi:transcriptional regulator with XRE-family HTH domain
MQTEIDRLQEFIDTRGWSKSEFAEQIGIQKQNVSKYLSGALKVEGLYGKLMDMGCDIQWLRTGQRIEGAEQMLQLLRSRNITTPEQLEQLLNATDNVKKLTESLGDEVRMIGNLRDMGGMVRVPHISKAPGVSSGTPSSGTPSNTSQSLQSHRKE